MCLTCRDTVLEERSLQGIEKIEGRLGKLLEGCVHLSFEECVVEDQV